MRNPRNEKRQRVNKTLTRRLFFPVLKSPSRKGVLVRAQPPAPSVGKSPAHGSRSPLCSGSIRVQMTRFVFLSAAATTRVVAAQWRCRSVDASRWRIGINAEQGKRFVGEGES